MKLFSFIFILLFSVARLVNGQPQEVKELSNGNLLIEDFEGESPGTLPQRWYNQKANTAVPEMTNRDTYKYEITKEDGNTFLRFSGVHGKHLNFPTKEVQNINIYDTPILSWKWRIHDFPEGGADDGDKDVAASIYVVFDMGRVLFKRVPKSIRYTWSSGLEKGKEFSKFFGNQKTIVMGTGDENIGQWQTFNRNIVTDYMRLFGDKAPKTPLAILILSDGDDTEKMVKADYDNIMLKSSTN